MTDYIETNMEDTDNSYQWCGQFTFNFISFRVKHVLLTPWTTDGHSYSECEEVEDQECQG